MKTKNIGWVGVAIISVSLAIAGARAQNPSADTLVPQPTQAPPDANQVPPNGTQPPILVPPGQQTPGAPAPAAAQPPETTVPAVTGTTTAVGPSTGTNPAPAPNQAAAPGNAAPLNTVPDYLQRDQAITPEDQGMLAQMRQAVFPQGATEAWMGSVHFILKEGAVRLVGTVPSLQERQRIEGVVSQVPGVTRVYDALAVNPSAAVASTPTSGTNAVPGVTPAPVPAPTSYPITNADGTVVPNSAGTNTIYETAPPQQKQPR
jgi:hypothetical protein